LAVAAHVRAKVTTTPSEGRLQRAVLLMFDTVKESIDLQDLAAAFHQGTPTGVLNYLDIETRFNNAAKGAGLATHQNSIKEVLHTIFGEGAKAALQQLDKVPVRKATNTVGTQMTFDLNSPEAINFLDPGCIPEWWKPSGTGYSDTGSDWVDNTPTNSCTELQGCFRVWQ
jgi:hypothetical protein